MGLKEKVQLDIKSALKNQQTEKLEALRFFFSSMKNMEIEKQNKNLEENDLLALLRKQIKIYEEIIEQYVDAGQSKKAEQELLKLEFLKEYLPPPMNQKELSFLVSEVIIDIKAKDLSDQGLVIKEVRKRAGGSVDNVQIVQIVRQHLQQL